MRPVTVLAVVSEIFPLVKTGGLADVAGALPLALAAEQVHTTTLIPGYPAVLSALTDTETVRTWPTLFGGPAKLIRGRAAGLDLLAIDAPHLYARSGTPYLDPDGRDWPDNALRFGALGRVAAEIGSGALPALTPDVVHAHDWQAGLAPAFLHYSEGPRAGTVMTVHNMAFQGRCPAALLPTLGLPPSAFTIDGVEYYGTIGFLKAGLALADRITTVSPTYAAEIRTPEGGMGLDGLLRARAGVLHGILNGIDETVWDPANDALIPAQFTATKLPRRAANKAGLQARFGLAAAPDALLFAVISRLTPQKGLDLLLAALPAATTGGRAACTARHRRRRAGSRLHRRRRDQPRPRRLRDRLRRGARPHDPGRRRRALSTVALRAMRAHATLRPALWRAARSGPRRRPGRHRDRRQRSRACRRRRHRRAVRPGNARDAGRRHATHRRAVARTHGLAPVAAQRDEGRRLLAPPGRALCRAVSLADRRAHSVSAGQPEPLGAQADADGINVAVHSAHAEAIAFCLFDADDREVTRTILPARTGDVFHGHLAGIRPGARYGLRAYGPWDPARGHRFNSAKLLLDPFATAIDRPFRLHPSLFDGDADSASAMPKAIVEAANYDVPKRPPFAWDRQIIYELHVRGFTMRHPDIPPNLRGTFAGLAHPASIGHLTRLGVTTVELMSAAAWIDERHLPALGLSNYWGYNPVAFLAPDPRLAPGGWAEIRAAVTALHAAGISVVLDVVLNHTGEGDHLGPTLSLRGLDNAGCYRLQPNASYFINDTGCGNTLALDRPFVLRLAMDALRCWAVRGGIDGFRLDLATTLARRDSGFDPAAPLFAAIEQDPILSGRAFIAEPWDIGPGGYQLGAFPARWGEWNDQYRDTVRRFWRGDAGVLGDLATRFAGSADIFAARHRPLTRSINFVTARMTGFTLADLVSYTEKSNFQNGEDNRDGTDANYSWNSGADAPREVRALLATLLLSRGTPMLSMGDECGRSQHGNNNAYSQDNELSWLDWPAADQSLIDFTARLIRTRLAFPALTDGGMLTGQPTDTELSVEWRLPDGRALTPDDWQNPENRTLVAALYASDSRAVVVLHAGHTPFDVVLPEPHRGQRWRRIIDSTETIAPRSVALFIEEPGDAPRRRTGTTSEALDRLSRAAGISSNWWDVNGREHHVGDDTKHALLTAMRLPAKTPEDLADSEAALRLVHHEEIPLPPALVVPRRRAHHGADRPDHASLAYSDPRGRRRRRGLRRSPNLTLPPLPLGRHRLLLEDASDTTCHLAVVPERCYLPESGRRFGIAAHLYTLRRAGDQGIGDFTTLARLAEESRGGFTQGALVIGLNPLHACVPGRPHSRQSVPAVAPRIPRPNLHRRPQRCRRGCRRHGGLPTRLVGQATRLAIHVRRRRGQRSRVHRLRHRRRRSTATLRRIRGDRRSAGQHKLAPLAGEPAPPKRQRRRGHARGTHALRLLLAIPRRPPIRRSRQSRTTNKNLPRPRRRFRTRRRGGMGASG